MPSEFDRVAIARECLGRAMDEQIMAILQPAPVGAIAPMTVCQSTNDVLTLDSLRRAFQLICGAVPACFALPPDHRTANEVLARQRATQEQIRYRGLLEPPLPTMASVKYAATNTIGLTGYARNGRTRTFLSMGVVKHCDETPNWDTKAMAKGKRWPR